MILFENFAEKCEVASFLSPPSPPPSHTHLASPDSSLARIRTFSREQLRRSATLETMATAATPSFGSPVSSSTHSAGSSLASSPALTLRIARPRSPPSLPASALRALQPVRVALAASALHTRVGFAPSIPSDATAPDSTSVAMSSSPPLSLNALDAVLPETPAFTPTPTSGSASAFLPPSSTPDAAGTSSDLTTSDAHPHAHAHAHAHAAAATQGSITSPLISAPVPLPDPSPLPSPSLPLLQPSEQPPLL
eukprot:m.107701 g.107701  ORF g.107701 m.107701 type:complete len:251 (+) comp14253_c1_seq15:2419-3171(+)